MPDLSELQQAAGEVGTNLEGRFAAAEGVAAAEGAAAGGDADDEADSAEREAARARRRAAAELKVWREEGPGVTRRGRFEVSCLPPRAGVLPARRGPRSQHSVAPVRP